MDNTRIIYVRFGFIPAGGKSWNHLTHQPECGVSVYEAIERDGKIQIILPRLDTPILVSLSGVNERPLCEVKGTRIGTGSDGEPLLKPCWIVKENLKHG